MCANDVMALAVEEFLEQRGFQVPEDIMITGYDGIRRLSIISRILQRQGVISQK